MPRIIFGLFIVLHGLVHLLYFGQSAGYFELKAGMAWPDGSWVFSKFLGKEVTRNLASIALVAAGIGLVVGGAGILVSQFWGQPLIVGGTVFSSIVYILFWNGRMKNLADQGLIGILINITILVIALTVA